MWIRLKIAPQVCLFRVQYGPYLRENLGWLRLQSRVPKKQPSRSDRAGL